jgi:probable phosphoglycerate mutase
MNLYLVRHGESAFNAQGRIQGQTNVPLSDLGRQQSHALAAVFSKMPIEAVYSSPLERARETARPVAEALDLPLRLEERLMEIHAGIFQGKVWQEIQAEYPAEAARWTAHEPDFIIPGGESRRQLMKRGMAALEAIRATNLSEVVVVAHGGVLTAALKGLLGMPAERNPFNLFNASISQLRWDTQVRLITLNQVDHLPKLAGIHATRVGDL